MKFEVHILTPPLNKHIESIFHFKDFVPEHSIERVIPTGHIFLIFELDGIPRHTFDNDTLKANKTFTKAWVSGMHKNYISISAHANSEMFVIQFKPSGAYPFLHSPIENFNNRVLPAEGVFGEGILTLRDQLLLAKTSKDKFRISDAWLGSIFDKSKVPPEELLDSLAKLESCPVADYKQIIEDYPNSQKHLIDQFKKYVGITPKYYQRIVRFNDILKKLQQNESVVWSQIAYECGYSDQSHFIKEFNHFSGFNPQEFIEKELNKEEPNFFPLDGKG